MRTRPRKRWRTRYEDRNAWPRIITRVREPKWGTTYASTSKWGECESTQMQSQQEDARRRLRGMCWCKKELSVCSMAMESWVVYATNVYRRDGDVLLRNNTLEKELHTRVPLLLKTKLTSILSPYMLGVWGSSLKFAFLYWCPHKMHFHTQQ